MSCPPMAAMTGQQCSNVGFISNLDTQLLFCCYRLNDLTFYGLCKVFYEEYLLGANKREDFLLSNIMANCYIHRRMVSAL